MNPDMLNSLFEKFGAMIANHFKQNGQKYAMVGGAIVLSSAITLFASHKAHSKLEKKHRAEDARKYKASFDRRLKELEERHRDDEKVLKRKINDLCYSYGIDPIF